MSNFSIARAQSRHAICNLRFVSDGEGHRTRAQEAREEDTLSMQYCIVEMYRAFLLFLSCFLVRAAPPGTRDTNSN